ncbi:hypothetical protein BKA56DRAFT_283361 [Ilyonectria sp. MPI-CAGE-AT-0026]|nr:hypothetical protein BKA56DRAFT_283361 [Ilyonectria sp. MPI-CAGE-AT-0026]
MMSRYVYLIALAHLFIPAMTQMVITDEIGPMEHNWKFVVSRVDPSNKDFPLKLTNWELGYGSQVEENCDANAMLVPRKSGSGLVFHQDFDSTTMWTTIFNKTRPLSIAPAKGHTAVDDDKLQRVKLHCNKTHTSKLQTHLDDMVPTLFADTGGHFYACMRKVSAGEEPQVFYRTHEDLPEGCIDINLHPKCVPGPDRGEQNVGFCCSRIKYGCDSEETKRRWCVTNHDEE